MDDHKLKELWEDEKLPCDYKAILQEYLKSTDHLLDMGTVVMYYITIQ